MSKQRFTKKELAGIRAVLVSKYEDCAGHVRSDFHSIQAHGALTRPCASEDFEDPGTEVTAAIATRRRASCQLLLDAIHRIDSGGYGICEDCMADIPDIRLTRNPEVTTCVACQELREARAENNDSAWALYGLQERLRDATAS